MSKRVISKMFEYDNIRKLKHFKKKINKSINLKKCWKNFSYIKFLLF